MAVVNTKAQALQNADAKPVVFNNARVTRMDLHASVGTVESVSGDNTGSTYRTSRFPSNAKVSEVLLSNDALGGGCAADIGIYLAEEGAVVDADVFGSAVSLIAAQTKLDVTHESGVYDFADIDKPIWEVLGLSADPQVDYELVATLTADSASTTAPSSVE